MSVLTRPTLVLNRNWVPVHVTSAVRSITMLSNDVAKAVDHEDYRLYDWDEWVTLPVDGHDFIRSAKLLVRLPEVICLASYDRVPRKQALCNRRNILRRDHYTCQYCGDRLQVGELTVDHIVPRCQGGEFTWENMVAACVPCNSRKADRTPERAGMRLRRKPVKPPWKPFYASLGVRVEAWAKFLNADSLAAVG